MIFDQIKNPKAMIYYQIIQILQELLTNSCIPCILFIYSNDSEVKKLNITINNLSDSPIYEQIKEQIKAEIISGKLAEDKALPSIRMLAKDLRISVITTKRAYEELERQGYVYTIGGKGCFVAKRNLELLREENLRKIEEYLTKIAQLAKQCGLSTEDITEMLKTLEDL